MEEESSRKNEVERGDSGERAEQEEGKEERRRNGEKERVTI